MRSASFQKHEDQVKNQSKKYAVRPPKDLTSKYDAYMHRRQLDKIKADEKRLEEEEARRIAVSENFSSSLNTGTMSSVGNRKTVA